jgi:superfamily I DNA and/or RNA helicase
MIFSAVRSNSQGRIGFLENERRTNVALTRAQHGLIIVGNAETLSSNAKWKTLIAYFEVTGSLVNGFDEAIKKIKELKEHQILIDQLDAAKIEEIIDDDFM